MSKDMEIMKKSHVLIDEKYIDMFDKGMVSPKPIKHNGISYYKVHILDFIHKGGVFKNLNS